MNACQSLGWIGLLALIACVLPHSPAVAQPHMTGESYHYVDDTQPPDAFLTLRTEPSSTRGRRILEMPNGTLLDVLDKRDDGWWYVRVVANGKTGWVLNRSRDRMWIHCCRTKQTIVEKSVTGKKFVVELMTSTEMRHMGIAVTRIGRRGALPNACSTKRFAPGEVEVDNYMLSVSGDMLNHFRARGFSLESLCLALESYLLFDLETGKPLPLGRIIRKDADGPTFPLNVPDCFRNGTPILDCNVKYWWLSGDKDDAETRGRLERKAEVHEIHERIRAHLKDKEPGWYPSPLELGIPKRLQSEILLEWMYFLTGAYQISPNLPRGYGYTLQGPEGDDPEPVKADHRTDPKKSGVAPPWNQPR